MLIQILICFNFILAYYIICVLQSNFILENLYFIIIFFIKKLLTKIK